jgi:hypothetical protein
MSGPRLVLPLTPATSALELTHVSCHYPEGDPVSHNMVTLVFSARYKIAEQMKSTEPGFTNERQQKVIRRVCRSPSHGNQYTYELECQICKHRYGANGCDIVCAGAGKGCVCHISHQRGVLAIQFDEPPFVPIGKQDGNYLLAQQGESVPQLRSAIGTEARMLSRAVLC